MNFTDAVLAAHKRLLSEDEKNLILGLGVNYPNGADGTTKGLALEFPAQVLDVPVSELAFSGMAVGLASQGYRPVVHHGRVEFALLAFDQILTQAARWNYMFGNDYPCPAAFRICIGRQWGNGPQHTANYHSIFLQAPGLEVFIPATPQEAYDQLIHSSKISNPSVFLEHRWLYKTIQSVEQGGANLEKLNSATLYGGGNRNGILIVTYGDGLIEALRTMDIVGHDSVSILSLSYFSAEMRVSSEVLDIIRSFGAIVWLDTAPKEFGLLSGISALVLEKIGLKGGGFRSIFLAPPFLPCATSPLISGKYYPIAPEIEDSVRNLLGLRRKKEINRYSFDDTHLPPSFNYDLYEGTLVF